MKSSFLQSLEWEQFYRGLGHETLRCGDMLMIEQRLPFGFRYWYSPRPELMAENASAVFLEARRRAACKGGIFLHVDPVVALPDFSKEAGIVVPAVTVQPQQTILLELEKPPVQLLRDMHPKTRYNIGLAERKGVVVKQRTFPVAKETFSVCWSLLRETAQRDQFRLHPRSYYEALLAVHTGDFTTEVFEAWYQGTVIALALVNFYGPSRVATYVHGGSSRLHKDVMAPALLHWRIIEDAMRRGFTQYDFWGSDEARWPGLTRFKRGFGGRTVLYPPAVRIIYRPQLYRWYEIARRIRALGVG